MKAAQPTLIAIFTNSVVGLIIKRFDRLTVPSSAVETVVLAPEGLLPVRRNFRIKFTIRILSVTLLSDTGEDFEATVIIYSGFEVAERLIVRKDTAFVGILERGEAID